MDTLINLIEKDTFSFVISIVAVIVSVTALIYQGIYSKLHKKTLEEIIHDMEVKIADAKLHVSKLPEDEKREAFKKLRALDEILKEYYGETLPNRTKAQKESGIISQEFMLYAVPAIIALSFTFALIYLLVVNQANPDYQSPEILKSGITTIIGYYFGVAVKDKPKESNIKEIDLKEFQRQLAEIMSPNKKRQQDA